jgi:hypothetical protein
VTVDSLDNTTSQGEGSQTSRGGNGDEFASGSGALGTHLAKPHGRESLLLARRRPSNDDMQATRPNVSACRRAAEVGINGIVAAKASQ